MSIIRFDRTTCGRCPVAALCGASEDDWTDAQKDAWAAAVDMNARPCNEGEPA